MKTPINTLIILISLLFLVSGCGDQNHQKRTDLIIFHAGSLTIPVKQISEAFQKENPNINILTEAAGSVACARKITDLNRPCDLMLSADYAVIDKFLIPEYADWNIKFASNEMVIAFNQKSMMTAEIDKNIPIKILLKDDVRYGRSNPDTDPCGYRTVLCLDLAETYYSLPNFAKSVLQKDNRFIRPKETDLIALLQTNTIDYIFIYRSVAAQHQLKYFTLPDSINLKNPKYANWYKNATVEIAGKKPGEKIKQYGEPMIYGLTILNDAPNKDLALKFAAFFLDKNKGMAIMKKNGQPSLVPSPSREWNKIPEPLQQFALPY